MDLETDELETKALETDVPLVGKRPRLSDIAFEMHPTKSK